MEVLVKLLMKPKSFIHLCLGLITVLALVWSSQSSMAEDQFPTADWNSPTLTPFQQRVLQDYQPSQNLEPMAFTPCISGFAGTYPCQNADLLAFMPTSSIGGGNTNDIWGWTDSLTGKEYAIVGRTTGTSFVDISDPINPVYLGNLPAHSSSSLWRGIKVYNNHAFIVSEASSHGMQVFDLTQLRDVTTPPDTFAETAHYAQISNTHTIAINEDTGYAYLAGTNTCSGGLHMVNIQNPTSPTFAGCFSADGYTHEPQCIVYNGPDTPYVGHEICFAYNEDTVTIVDVTNKAAPVQLSRTGYSGSAYTHQGWIIEDHTHIVFDDELDESSFGHGTRSRIMNVSDLNAPVMASVYTSSNPAIDHNLYIVGNLVFESNYRSGLRILEFDKMLAGDPAEVAYFDVYPSNDNPSFNGTWSNYPFFASGVVIVAGIEQGLFMVQPNFSDPVPLATMNYQYFMNDGASGSGSFTFWQDGTFSDEDSNGGTWGYQQNPPRIQFVYDDGSNCESLSLGWFQGGGQIAGLRLCTDNDPARGVWSATIVTGKLEDLSFK